MFNDTLDGKTYFCTHPNQNTDGLCSNCLGSGDRLLKKKLRAEWKQYMADNPQLKRTLGNHHYFRSRYASKFWLKKIAELLTKKP